MISNIFRSIFAVNLAQVNFHYNLAAAQLTANNLTTSPDTMIRGWPDFIRCGGSSEIGHVFALHNANSDYSFYMQVYFSETRSVKFDDNGNYLNKGGADVTNSGCLGQSIPQLYQAGRAFNLVTSRSPDASGNSTILKGFPDAIRCGVGASGNVAPSGAVFFLRDFDSGLVVYAQVYADEDRSINFDGNGNYINKTGDDNSSRGCLGQSISQLYSSGRAFNLVTSRTIDNTGTNSMIAGWPDAIQCINSVNFKKIIFLLHGAITGTTGSYVQDYAPNRMVYFDGSGKFSKGEGNPDAIGDCKTKTIQQLADAGRVYNFVTSKTQNTAPTCNDFSLTLKPTDSGALNFASLINDYEEGTAKLKVKIYSLPTCTIITTTNGVIVTASSSQDASVGADAIDPEIDPPVAVNLSNIPNASTAVGGVYSQNALFYKACSSSMQDTLSYSTIDSGSLESPRCNLNFVSTPNFCLTFKLGASTLSQSCTINNFYYNKYLTTDCSQSKTSYFDITQTQDGYFLLTANQEQLYITKVSSSLFLLKHVNTDTYLSLEDGQNISYLKTATNKSYWKIQGTCNFINNKLYNKFSISEIESRPACNAKITLDKVSLVTKTFAASGSDLVTITLSCGNTIKQFSDVFSANSAVKTFTGSITCDGANDRLDISISVNNVQRFTFQVPKGSYSKYPDNLHVRYSASEQDMNSGEITIVSFSGNVSATCSASFSALSQLNASGKIDAGCEAIVSGNGRGDMPWPLSDAKISMSLKATCSAYLNASAAAKATFNFQAQCAADLNASGSVVVKNICASSDSSSSMTMKSAANLLSIFNSEINADSYLLSNTNACAFINNIAKYLIDVTYSYDNQPFCFVPNDFLFLSGKTLELSRVVSDNKINNIQIKSALFTQSYAFSTYYPKSQLQNLKIPCAGSAQVVIMDGKNTTTTKTLPCTNNTNLPVSKTTINLQAEDVSDFYSLIQDKSSPALYPESAAAQDFALNVSCYNDVLGYIARAFMFWQKPVCSIDMNFDAPNVLNANCIYLKSEPSKGRVVQKSGWLFNDAHKSPDLFGTKYCYSPDELRYEADLLFHNLPTGFKDAIKFTASDSSGYESPEAVINLSFAQEASDLDPYLLTLPMLGLMLLEIC